MAKTASDIRKVIITGPESTGKSQLAKELAIHYRAEFIPEYARDYISTLHRDYNYTDVLNIAEEQVKQMNDVSQKKSGIVFFDTYLIITKVWMQVVFNTYPDWLDQAISKTTDTLYLLCRPDIPWVPDKYRENGGEMRIVLFKKYEEELRQHKLNYCYIEGAGINRKNCAIKNINRFITKDDN